MSVRPIFAWFDLWIGVFIDRPNRRVYIFPLPCIGFVITLRPKTHSGGNVHGDGAVEVGGILRSAPSPPPGETQ